MSLGGVGDTFLELNRGEWGRHGSAELRAAVGLSGVNCPLSRYKFHTATRCKALVVSSFFRFLSVILHLPHDGAAGGGGSWEVLVTVVAVLFIVATQTLGCRFFFLAQVQNEEPRC